MNPEYYCIYSKLSEKEIEEGLTLAMHLIKFCLKHDLNKHTYKTFCISMWNACPLVSDEDKFKEDD